ncbi:MAG: helix-turn-helix domain-containing protein, partial [Vicinamibacteria bacterium]|nr:helix-turn-helix domain-containing protein [Vicinamibacteria bacterium]
MTSFGASLRRERELRGVSLQEIAAATKIGVRMLQAIEEDRLDKLPQGLFVRGFVREYARFLALDEQKILTELTFHAAPAPT